MSRNPSREHRLALLRIHLAVLLAGGTGLFGKLLDTTPAVITAGRTVVASLALAVIALLLRITLRIHCARDWMVFAENKRGTTDRFVLKFVKP